MAAVISRSGKLLLKVPTKLLIPQVIENVIGIRFMHLLSYLPAAVKINVQKIEFYSDGLGACDLVVVILR